MKRVIIATALLSAWFSAATAGTLDTVKQRGTLVCGVSAGFAGFSAPDSQGNYKGLDVDYWRALAAGVLGDPSKVRYVALTAQNRFTALQSGEIDVLYRNSTQTYLRGVTLGLRPGPVNFYDGQGFVVKRRSGVKALKGHTGHPASARRRRRTRLAARSRQQMDAAGDQGRRQLRRDLRAQRRQGKPAEARPRPQRHLEQGRPDVRDSVQVNTARGAG